MAHFEIINIGASVLVGFILVHKGCSVNQAVASIIGLMIMVATLGRVGQ